jgi:hypothetical protein
MTSQPVHAPVRESLRETPSVRAVVAATARLTCDEVVLAGGEHARDIDHRAFLDEDV